MKSRSVFSVGAVLILLTHGGARADDANATPGKPNFAISRQVAISVPDPAIEKSFWIAATLTSEMRRIACENYKHDGWLAVSMGKNGPQAGYDPRDFRYGPKCAAYLWGDDPSFLPEMGKRIFFDEHDKNGMLTWDPTGQTGIHIAHVAKHFSDYLRYSGRDEFIKAHWDRLLKIVKWSLANYDRNDDGLIEQGQHVTEYVWLYLVGEPLNSPKLDQTQNDVIVVASMEVCEWLQLLAEFGRKHGLPEVDWLQAKADKSREAIETFAYDTDAGYYYLTRRDAEKKWYHSGAGLNEESRELDVMPYYSAFVSGNFTRGRKIAAYARSALLDQNLFPMPLFWPTYSWSCPNYGCYHCFVPGGCWEESYYNCVRAFGKYGMIDAAFAAIKRRSDAYVRDNQCSEWYETNGTIQGRDQYGISGAAHVSAIIEGLFGITPTQFGFDEVNLWPAMPATWIDRPATLCVTLPDGGFLKTTYLNDSKTKTVTLSVETNRQRQAHLRVPVPGQLKSVDWNGERVFADAASLVNPGIDIVILDRPIEKSVLTARY